MDKQKMKYLLVHHNGIGVKVITKNETNDNFVNYYFYEDFDNYNGIDRAYEQFKKEPDVRLVFYSNKWAMQYTFKEYLEGFNKLRKLVQENTEDIFLQKQYKKYQEFLIQKLQKYTDFSVEKATEQILNYSISFNKFKEMI